MVLTQKRYIQKINTKYKLRNKHTKKLKVNKIIIPKNKKHIKK